MSETYTQDDFDAVIVGAGVAGSLIAKRLAKAGKRVAVVEAGSGFNLDDSERLERYYKSFNKFPSSAYLPELYEGDKLANPGKQNAPRPVLIALRSDRWQDPEQSYLIQKGPLAFGSTFERSTGGTGLQWLGVSLRHIPNDFSTHTIYGVGKDWPIDYSDLTRWYGEAEHEMGVSGTTEQPGLNLYFEENYAYPMPPLQRSLVDQYIDDHIKGFEIDGKELHVSTTPMAINSRPYHDRGPCDGSSSCLPVCPTQAKYDPRRSLKDALDTGNVTLFDQSVAYDVVLGDDGKVGEIRCKRYEEQGGPLSYELILKGKVFILAANGIETPKLLLMSKNNGHTPNGVANFSNQVGRNLMDHPLLIAWGLSPSPIYPYRGPLSTAGIESLRDSSTRKDRAAYRIEIGNAGWNFPYQDPKTTTFDLITGTNFTGLNPDHKTYTGKTLAAKLGNLLSRQFHLTFEIEQLPDPSNRVSVSDHTDNLGIPRPQIHYDLCDYTRRGLLHARRVSDKIFSQIRAENHTLWPFPDGPTVFEAEDALGREKLAYFGGGHIAGTYCMGTSPATSVVDKTQRSWDHPNLFLVGSGVFPTIATANPTLTLAALALLTAETILKDV